MWSGVLDSAKLRLRSGQHPLRDDTMLKYFISQLDVRTKLIAPGLSTESQKTVMGEIRTKLDSFSTTSGTTYENPVEDAWTEAYRLRAADGADRATHTPSSSRLCR